ncbi:hypothetical protein [Rubellicoccus peritrichatus]|uniref:DNA replication/recombination mediator RecO N-terminal domain-containing protein n=1 Tax=Rubellicoccus peritrichatus TaxID=3080537 RepID=A0AAQ3L9W5_9BACT|nr:hypothetical protein [Puniceicoccus sp. CR14]WOO40357.1 hypothetical protein RZN69_17195 [Puniceicoccus sp. CR14]
MPERFETIRATVLHRELTGESHFRIHTFDAVKGGCRLLFRYTKGKRGTTPPDLFDFGEFVIEPAKGGSWFVKEFRLERGRLAIPKKYDVFQYACRFIEIFRRNTEHIHEAEGPAEVLDKALDAFENGIRPDVTLFKSLYLLARSEGFPVKEQFIADLPSSGRALAAELLNRPLSEQTAPPNKVEPLIHRIQAWLSGHADFVI